MMADEPEQTTPGVVERVTELLSCLAIVAMVVIVAAEVVARNAFGFSFQVSDEYGGYLIAVVSVLSLAPCQARHAFHRVDLVQGRLGPRVQAGSRFMFDLMCIAFVLVVAWQFLRLFLQSWRSGDVAPTLLETPYWVPQLFMPLGAVALLMPLGRACAGHFRAAFRGGAAR